jgi:hypothetical protein
MLVRCTNCNGCAVDDGGGRGVSHGKEGLLIIYQFIIKTSLDSSVYLHTKEGSDTKRERENVQVKQNWLMSNYVKCCFNDSDVHF